MLRQVLFRLLHCAYVVSDHHYHPCSVSGRKLQKVIPQGLDRLLDSGQRLLWPAQIPWDTVPQYLLPDSDCAYGKVFRKILSALGIRDRPIAPRSPWQNGYVERVIGSIRRDLLDHWLCSVKHISVGCFVLTQNTVTPIGPISG